MKKIVGLFIGLALMFSFVSSQALAQNSRTGDSQAGGDKKMTGEKAQEEAPFACVLTALTAAERERHKELSNQLRSSVKEVKELPNGYGFQLPGERREIAMVAEWVSLERLCCPFFKFQLEIGSEGKPMWLHITGREGVKQFMQVEFGIK